MKKNAKTLDAAHSLVIELKKCAKNKNLSGVFSVAKKISASQPPMQILANLVGGRLAADVAKLVHTLQLQRCLDRISTECYGGPRASVLRTFRKFCTLRNRDSDGGRVVAEILQGEFIAREVRTGKSWHLGGSSLDYAERRKLLVKLQEIADKLK